MNNISVAYILNLESKGKSLENNFFEKINSNSVKNTVKELMNFDIIKIKRIGHDKSKKVLSKDLSFKNILNQWIKNKNIKTIHFLFIIDNDKIIKKDIKELFDDYSTQIKDIMKKIKKKIIYINISLPTNQTFEYIIATCLNNKNVSLKGNEKTYELIKTLYPNVKNNSISETHRKLSSDSDVFRKINKLLVDKTGKNIIHHWKANIFKDESHLNYRKRIKTDNWDTYHYLFDWFC